MTLAVLVCKKGRQVYRMYITKGGLLKIAKDSRGGAPPHPLNPPLFGVFQSGVSSRYLKVTDSQNVSAAQGHPRSLILVPKARTVCYFIY